jgi:hypothetical protein
LSEPTLIVECAFASDPGATSPTWTDISGYVMQFGTRRGRQKELDRIDPGTCTLRLNNSDRRFDPTYAAGPYYPNVLPMRKLRVRATYNAVTYNLFVGYVEAWPQEWPGGNTVAYSTITVTDGFLPLSRADIGEGAVWAQEFSGARVARALDALSWPAGDRAIDTGYSKIAETSVELGAGDTVLGHIEDVADAELGIFFIDGQGRAVFHDRHHRRGASYLSTQATFDDTGGQVTYTDLVPEYTVERVWNDVRVSALGGETQQAEDATSQATYLRRTMTRSVPLARDTEAADQAAYLLAQYKNPQYRLTQMAVKPVTDAQWAQVLGREFSDHLTVKRHPPPVGSAVISQECFVEAIEHRASPKQWETRWLLSTPAFTAVNWWLLADSTYGVLGTTTKPVY